ncbi:hypothetical protein F5B19DRAFT_446862 [Rostrohypoxylon terebratum]|nr:hypothetical protein F5B19DRAFT_446862 [Rostrohypoxylon terebratum]
MDSLSNRGRGRKRHTSHISPPPSSPSQNPAQDLPELPPTSDTSGPLAPLSSTSEAHSPSAPLSTRMRTRQVDETKSSPGGRSLRKRPRVDYTFEQLLDAENGPKPTTGTSRSFKRRRTDFALNENDLDDDSESRLDTRFKRRASEQPQSSSSRKRSTTKGPIEPQAFEPAHQDDVEVQDTIEVGGHHSEESDESLIRRTSSSSSNNDTKLAPESASSGSATIQLPQSLQSLPASHMSSSQPLTLPSNHLAPVESVPKVPQDRIQANLSEDLSKDAKSTRQQLPEVGHDQDGPDSLSHLTPYIDGHIYYPEDDPEPEADPDAEADLNAEADANMDSDRTTVANGHSNENAAADDKTDLLAEDTPAATAANSPSVEVETTPAQLPEKKRYKFRQTRSASEFTDLFQNIESLSPAELYRRLEVANKALVAWQNEYRELKKITDDYDNSVRYKREEDNFVRRSNMAASKNPESIPVEKDFVVKGERAQDTTDPIVKYQRQQDKIMADAYGFEYDPRESKVGLQDPIAQRTGAGRQGRLRERPKQTAKAAELDEPVVLQGKRVRKAPERFAGDEVISRGSTPVPSQRRGRRNNVAPENGEQNPPQPLPQAKGHFQLFQSEPQSQALSSSFSSSQTHTEVQDPTVSTRDYLPAHMPEHSEKETPKKKGKGGRPRKNNAPEPVAETEPTPAATLINTPSSQSRSEPKSEPDQTQAPLETRANLQHDTESNPESPNNVTAKRERESGDAAEEQPSRKRRRRAPPAASTSSPNHVLPPPPAPAASFTEQDDNMTNDAEPQVPAKSTRRRSTKKLEVPSESSNVSANASSTVPAEEPRPQTASSTATADTVVSTSNYQLREKRQRKFTNDITDDEFIEEPKRKRARRATKKPQVKKEEISPARQTSSPQRLEPEAPALPKPTRIIFKSKPTPQPHPTSTPGSTGPSSTPHTKANTNDGGSVAGNGITGFDAADAGSGGAGPPKDYSTMTKSEKMSASMKARWASGSMGGAVIKRRATLAAKKQSGKPSEVTNYAGPDQAPTPVSTHRPTSEEDIDDDDDVSVVEQ